MTAVPAGPDTGDVEVGRRDHEGTGGRAGLELFQMRVVHFPAGLIAQSRSWPGVARTDTPAGLKMSVSGASFPRRPRVQVTSAPIGPDAVKQSTAPVDTIFSVSGATANVSAEHLDGFVIRCVCMLNLPVCVAW